MNTLALVSNFLWLILILIPVTIIIWVIQKQRKLAQARQARQIAMIQEALMEVKMQKMKNAATSETKEETPNQ